MIEIYLAPALFLVIAFIFSMLGMGGAQLYVPILFWLGMDFKTQAIPLGLLLGVVVSSSAALTYGRKGMIEWKIAIPFGLAMILLAPLGGWVNIGLPTKLVIIIFALFTIAGATVMLTGWQPKHSELSSKGRLILGTSGGSIIGFFAGLLGRGGGAFVVPLLYVAGLEAKVAVATSAFVVTCSGTSAFLSHILTAAQPQWVVWILCLISVFIGSQLGSRLMAAKIESKYIKLIFGIVLLGVAATLLFQGFSM